MPQDVRAHRGFPLGGRWYAPLSWLLVIGCLDTFKPAPTPISAPADHFVVQVVVTPLVLARHYLVRATLSSGATAGRIGGFRARLVLPAGVDAVDSLQVQDVASGTMTRFIRHEGSDVVAVGAAPEGLAAGDLFIVRVTTDRASQLEALRLEFLELVDVTGADRLDRVITAPRARVEGRR